MRAGDNKVDLGVIEFHGRLNQGLSKRFYEVVEDLRNAGCIVDIWLMDFAAVLREHGYEMAVTRTPAKQDQIEEFLRARVSQ